MFLAPFSPRATKLVAGMERITALLDRRELQCENASKVNWSRTLWTKPAESSPETAAEETGAGTKKKSGHRYSIAPTTCVAPFET